MHDSRKVGDKLRKLETDLKGKGSREERDLLFLGNDDSFSKEIMLAKVSRNFKSLDMDIYDGTTDP
ncbi:hypothetical protein AHAS_Ahas05G0158500 [Arachis hypogaea]